MSSIFDILGPVMVGPSSSHTAGAVRIGLMCRELLHEDPVKARITLCGSFAATGHGHGTDCALIAGLLGFQTHDLRIPQSLDLAKDAGLDFSFSQKELFDAHPNTAIIELTGINGRELSVQASSIGGGRIMINKIDGIDVNFTGEKPTLIVHNYDQSGHVAAVTSLFHFNKINIASMQLFRNQKGGYAVMVIESDEEIPKEIIAQIEKYDGIIKVTLCNALL
ncbi:MAG: L-serine ammonia-lyase, iron-sulfur-dependent subunit beta [Treponema sp.]|nr:L-serine ammonia-lyase, iron-sulfur-dependent subunit beta [Treponema sp.]